MQSDWAKKGLIISIIITGVLVVGFIAETVGIIGGEGGGGGGPTEVYFMCFNPDCEATYSMSIDEYRELMAQMGPMMMGPMMGQTMAFECKECGQQTAYIATKCPKCGAIFMMDYESDDYADRCPECGYSKTEELLKER